MSLEGRALRKGARAGRAKAHFQRDSLGKTGRRLTSDPIRTSLGLLPSGPDPVGEWLVHRQSPGPYLGPKGPESKRDGGPHPGRTRPCKKGVDARHKAGHDGVLFAGQVSATFQGTNRETECPPPG